MTNDAGRTPLRSIGIDEARAKIADGSVEVVDIRPPFDFAGGHIPHSLNLPGTALRARMGQLRLDREILLVDADGSQSAAGAALAASLGFAAVTTLDGGFEAWLAAGYPVHTISDSMAG
jgi:rhodanese-related sulfurtransferase